MRRSPSSVNLKSPPAKACFGRRLALRFPIAAVPDLDRAAAIFALRDGAFEVAVVERMVLDLDGEPLVCRIERWAARHRPGLEHAIQLETQVVVQAGRRMLLDDKAAPIRATIEVSPLGSAVLVKSRLAR